MANHLLSDDDIQFIVEQAFAEGALWMTQNQTHNAAEATAIVVKDIINYLNQPINEQTNGDNSTGEAKA